MLMILSFAFKALGLLSACLRMLLYLYQFASRDTHASACSTVDFVSATAASVLGEYGNTNVVD